MNFFIRINMSLCFLFPLLLISSLFVSLAYFEGTELAHKFIQVFSIVVVLFLLDLVLEKLKARKLKKIFMLITSVLITFLYIEITQQSQGVLIGFITALFSFIYLFSYIGGTYLNLYLEDRLDDSKYSYTPSALIAGIANLSPILIFSFIDSKVVIVITLYSVITIALVMINFIEFRSCKLYAS